MIELTDKQLWKMVADVTWYAHPNNILNDGSWCVTNTSVSPAQMQIKKGQVGIADFTSQEAADHIADVHNESLELHCQFDCGGCHAE